jgi:hypothetical protein
MMHGPEKSDLAIVAMKPANKAERSAAELVEPRAGTKGNAGQQSTHRTQSRVSVSQVLARIRQQCRQYSRWEPYAGKPHVRICAGGREVTRVPTANLLLLARCMLRDAISRARNQKVLSSRATALVVCRRRTYGGSAPKWGNLWSVHLC